MFLVEVGERDREATQLPLLFPKYCMYCCFAPMGRCGFVLCGTWGRGQGGSYKKEFDMMVLYLWSPFHIFQPNPKFFVHSRSNGRGNVALGVRASHSHGCASVWYREYITGKVSGIRHRRRSKACVARWNAVYISY